MTEVKVKPEPVDVDIVQPTVSVYNSQGMIPPVTIKPEDKTLVATTPTTVATEDPEIKVARDFASSMVGALELHELKDAWNLKPGDQKPDNWLEYFEPKQRMFISSAFIDAFPGGAQGDKLDLSSIAKSVSATTHFGNLVKYHVAMDKMIKGQYQQTTVTPYLMTIRFQALEYFKR